MSSYSCIKVSGNRKNALKYEAAHTSAMQSPRARGGNLLYIYIVPNNTVETAGAQAAYSFSKRVLSTYPVRPIRSSISGTQAQHAMSPYIFPLPEPATDCIVLTCPRSPDRHLHQLLWLPPQLEGAHQSSSGPRKTSPSSDQCRPPPLCSALLLGSLWGCISVSRLE